MSLARAAVRGAVAVMASELLTRAASVASLLIVARLLGPTELGRAAIAILALTAIESLVALGLGAAVQASDDPAAAASGAGALAIMVGVAGATAAVAGASFIATSLGDPSAAPLLQGLAPVVLLARWNEVQSATIERRLHFSRTSSISIVSSLAAAGASVGAATAGAGAWSVVIQPVVRESLTTIGLLSAPGRSSLVPRFDLREMRGVWRLSKHLLANTLVVFLYTNLDDAAVSRFLGTTALGLYGFAYRVSNFPTYFFTRTLNRVLLPLWVKVREDRRAWASAYSATLRLLAWSTGSIMCAIAALGPAALDAFYGEQWEGAKTPLTILAVYGLFRAVGATTGAVFIADGQPQRIRQIAQVQLLVMVLLLAPAVSNDSIALVAAAVTMPLAVGVLYGLIQAGKVVGLSVKEVALHVGEPWTAAILANLLGLGVASLLPSQPLLALGLGAAVSAIGCGSYGYLRFRPDLTRVLGALRAENKSSPDESSPGASDGPRNQ